MDNPSPAERLFSFPGAKPEKRNVALIDDLQAKRSDLGKAIKEIADRLTDPDATPTAEDNAKWEELNASYNANLELLNAERTKLEKEEATRKAIDDRLKEIEGYADWAPRNRNFGRDGGTLDAGPVNGPTFRSLAADRQFFVNQAKALRGWMMATCEDQDVQDCVTDEHITAAKAVRQRLNANSFKLRLGNTGQFKNVQQYFNRGVLTKSQLSHNALTILNDMQAGKLNTGGAFIGETMLDKLTVALLSYAGVMQVADILVTDNGETLRWPGLNDTQNMGNRVGEGQDAGFDTSVDPSISRLSLQAFIFTSQFLDVSRAFLTDSSIDMEGMFGDMLGVRIARKFNLDFTTGVGGGGAPQGIVTGAMLGITGASSTAIAFDELIDLVHTVDPAVRDLPGVGYMFHDKILNALRKLKNGMGDYLWSAGTDANAPDKLNGWPHWMNQAMANTVASGNTTIIFGAMPRYKVRLVNEVKVQRLVERRAEFYEDAFIAYMRADGGLMDPGDHPIKSYVQAA